MLVYRKTCSMKKKIITRGPSFANLVDALQRRDSLNFTINDEVYIVSPLGMEIAEGVNPTTYDLKVRVFDMKIVGYQHFRYCPNNGQGEWIGRFERDHKAYEGHSFSEEIGEIRERTKPRGWPYEG
jgi:hypothetical protein